MSRSLCQWPYFLGKKVQVKWGFINVKLINHSLTLFRRTLFTPLLCKLNVSAHAPLRPVLRSANSNVRAFTPSLSFADTNRSRPFQIRSRLDCCERKNFYHPPALHTGPVEGCRRLSVTLYIDIITLKGQIFPKHVLS